MGKEKQTPFGLVSKAVFKELRKAGWSAGRNEKHIVEEYCELLGKQWVPAAGPFVWSFGGLSFYGKLWPWKNPVWDRDLIDSGNKIAEVIGSKVVPVASSSYMCEGCVVWVDEYGRFYAANTEGMIFIASDIAGLLEVLLGNDPPSEPPPEVRDKLINGYEWIAE